MKLITKLAIGFGGIILILRLSYKDPMDNWEPVEGRSWGNEVPKSNRQIEQEEKIRNNFQPYNNGYKTHANEGYGTFGVIRKCRYPGGYEKMEIKWDAPFMPGQELDLSDPYIQDLIEDETQN